MLISKTDVNFDAVSGVDGYDGKRVVITGGLGFIGSNLARSLVEVGAIVTLVDSLIPEYGGNLANISGFEKTVNVNVCDVRDPHAMKQLLRGSDFVFNLAGQTSHLDSMKDPLTDLAINTAAQLSLLESCREVAPECKVVFASTRQIYGKPQYLPVDEKHPIKPVDVNGINKWSGEAYHILYSEVYGLKSTVLRLTNTYGPRMRIRDARQTFLGVWIRNVSEGSVFSIFGTGQQLRDFNYVEDVVRALLLAGQSPQADGKIYNLGSHEVVSLQQLADALRIVDPRAVYEIVPFPKEREVIDIGNYYGDFSSIERDLGWVPQISLDEGLRSTLEYFKPRLAEYCG